MTDTSPECMWLYSYGFVGVVAKANLIGYLTYKLIEPLFLLFSQTKGNEFLFYVLNLPFDTTTKKKP